MNIETLIQNVIEPHLKKLPSNMHPVAKVMFIRGMSTGIKTAWKTIGTVPNPKQASEVLNEIIDSCTETVQDITSQWLKDNDPSRN